MITTLLLALFACSDKVLSVHDEPPVATITSPGDGAALLEGDIVEVLGQATDYEATRDGVALTVTWYADDVEICTGSTADAEGVVTCDWQVTEGAAQLRLIVEDTAHQTAEDAIGVSVTANEPPQIAIVTPEADGEYYFDAAVTLEALVSDAESPAEDLLVSWSSDVDGSLATDAAAASSGSSATAVTLSEGDHLLTATVTDPGGNTDIATVEVTVHGANTAPDCGFTSPEDGATVALGDVLTLAGVVSDLETTPTALGLGLATQLEDISQDIPVDDEGNFTWPWVPTVAGTHVVTLAGEDGRGETCTDTLTVEVCDSAWYADTDSDGYGDTADSVVGCEAPDGYVRSDGDCNDRSATVYPGAAYEESLADCMQDEDGDGWGDASVPAGVTAGTDCDDDDDALNPGAQEVCDDADNDCDGTTDGASAADASTWYADADGDGYGEVSASSLDCEAPSGYVADATDCDDGDAGDHPGATEDCDGDDDDCDGDVDEEGTTTFYADDDGDGYGDTRDTTEGCTAPSGYVSDATDCDDGDGDVHPGASESCDEVDEDCDGTVDDGASLTWYADDDGDGYGDASTSAEQCTAPTGYVADSGDCHDGDADTWPGAAAEESPSACMQDRDGDGWGDDAPPSGVTPGTDCDDGDATINPDAAEVCDGADDDCDGSVDEAVTVTVYADADGDGFGDAAAPAAACSAGADQSANDDDCDDGEADVNPDATEVCDAIDNDCDGDIDDDDTSLDSSTGYTFYADADSDGYGDAAASVDACEAPANHVSDATDCDDGDATTYPWAGDEYSDGVDQDCDGLDCEGSSVSGSYYAVCACTDCAWTTAESYCTGAGYDALASIPTSTVDDALRDMALEINTSDHNMWFGMQYPWTTFSDGTSASYSNWYSGEPNLGASGFGYKSISSAYGWRWADGASSGSGYTIRTYACSISGI